MKTISLPQKFFEKICSMHCKLGFKIFQAIGNYLLSEGEDKSIDSIYSSDAKELIAELKIWADKRIAAAKARREKRLAAKAENKAKYAEEEVQYNGMSIREMRHHIHLTFRDDRIMKLAARKIVPLFNMLTSRFTTLFVARDQLKLALAHIPRPKKTAAPEWGSSTEIKI